MVLMDHSQSNSHLTYQAIVLDVDRSTGSWLFHLLTQSTGLLVARAPFAAHHPREYPPGIDRLALVEAELAPPRRTAYRSLSRLSLVKSRSSLGARIEAAAAAALLSELALRSRVTGPEAPALFALVNDLLDQLQTTPCSAPQGACYVLHQALTCLSFLSAQPNCPRCPPGLLTAPAHFHLSSGEVTCARHLATGEGPIEWGSDKLALHLMLLQRPPLQTFLDATAPLWERFGSGLAWSFLQDLIGFTEHIAGPMKSWSFLRQLRPLPRSTGK